MRSAKLLAKIGLVGAFVAGVPFGMAEAASPSPMAKAVAATKTCVPRCIYTWVCETPPWGNPDDCVFVYKVVCDCIPP